MHQSLTQQRSSDMSLPDSMGAFNRRKRNSIYVTVTLLIVSVLILTVGLAATTRTQNVTVGGYYPGVILGFGSFLGIIGSNLVENKRQMLVASIVFISFGVIAAFCCAIVDGVFAARHIDLKPLYANRCHYVPKTSQKEAEEVNCPHLSRGFCTPRIRGNTCFCCDLYNCGNRVEITGGYYEYIDVSSCQDIIHLYHLLWSATILNIVGLFLGIITAAVLGGFKDMNPALPALNCSVENAHPTVSYYARPQVASYNTYYHSPPHLPPYSAYDFQQTARILHPTPKRIICILMPLLLLVLFSVETSHDSVQDYESVTMPLCLQYLKCSQLDKFLSVIVDLKSIWHIVVGICTVLLIIHSFKPQSDEFNTSAPCLHFRMNTFIVILC
ncbi:transmembrane protein 255A isoform X2 [Balaenoptera ricei]|uniref:transmembrane protein 255A isoform X2 n=1 Tax=Balaenoptera ricei TaxID=2746895 RepID=UPI0028BE30F2|nr:transmembrane protein 255A isoform X2 [Balaenoptera ricei]